MDICGGRKSVNGMARIFTITETRKELIDDLRLLIILIDIQSQLLDIDELTEMIEQVNNLITTTMTNARISQWHSENDWKLN